MGLGRGGASCGSSACGDGGSGNRGGGGKSGRGGGLWGSVTDGRLGCGIGGELSAQLESLESEKEDINTSTL